MGRHDTERSGRDTRPDAAGAASAGASIGAPVLAGLEAMLRAQASDRPPPVEIWNPPYCGDIGMAIGVDGTWFYQGSPIGRKPLVKLFSRVLRRDLDGRHFLVTPVEKVDIAVADAPFLAVEMEVAGAGTAQDLIFRTNVDDIVRCGPDHPLRFAVEDRSGGLKPYLHVRGRLEALVTRALYYDLVELAVEDDAGQLGVWSGGVYFPLVAD
jgi:uncharacterized protein